MNWSSVGTWLKDNGTQSAALVGSLLTGNVPSAIAAGASLVSSVTGTTDPDKALDTLMNSADAQIRLQELANAESDSIRKHLEAMTAKELEDKQKAHEQTQLTIRNGDSQESKIRWVRPIHASIALVAAIAYVFVTDEPSETVMIFLFSLPAAYFGLREIGKGVVNIKGAVK